MVELGDKIKYLSLKDINAYEKAFRLRNVMWGIVIKWDNFGKRTIGSQFVRAIDSVSANIAEGFGRYTKKDKIRFYIISRGSVLECKDWNEKAKTRNLLTNEEYEFTRRELMELPKEINKLIKYTNEKLKI